MGKPRCRKPTVPIVDLATHPEAYVSLEQLAAYWGFSRQALVKWVHAGTLPASRFGRALRVKTTDAIAYAEDARITKSA